MVGLILLSWLILRPLLVRFGGGAKLDADSKIVNGRADLYGVIDLVASHATILIEV